MSLPRGILAIVVVGAVAASCGPSSVVSISSIEPASGPAGAAVEVRIRGLGFRNGAEVSFGAPATDVAILDDKTIFARTPIFRDGLVSVSVRNPDGATATREGGYQFVGVLPPMAQLVKPNAGLALWLVTITGYGFKPGAIVSFGGVNATQTIFLNANQLQAFVPQGPKGLVDVTVTNPDGVTSSTLASAFTVHIVTLMPSTSEAAAGGAMTVNWHSPVWTTTDFPEWDDWIGLFAVANPTQRAAAAWSTVVSSAQGTSGVIVPAQAGQYEFRYVSGGTVHAVAPLLVTSGLR